MQFDLDLVFQIKNIEMWNKFPFDNDPQKYKSHTEIVLQSSTMVIKMDEQHDQLMPQW